MSVDRDYVVGVGLALADDSIEAVSAQIKSALAQIPALQIKVTGIADLERLAATLQSVTANSISTSNAISRTASAINAQAASAGKVSSSASNLQDAWSHYSADQFKGQAKLNSELERSLNLFSRMEEQTARQNANFVQQGVREGRANYPSAGNNDALFNGSDVSDLIAKRRAASPNISPMYAEQYEALSKATGNQSRALDELDTRLSRNSQLIANNIGQVRAGAEAHRQSALGLPAEIKGYHGLADSMVRYIKTFAEWATAAKLVEGAQNMARQGMQDAIQSQREQVLQSFYYQAQGKSFDPVMSTSTMNEAIEMARTYGDDVMHVQEAIGLWAKDTQGQLVPALAMANSALKLSAVSGMDMEQIYRETSAVLAQTNQPLSEQAHLYDVAVAAATRYGGAMQSLEGQSDDMVKQMLEGIAQASVEFGKVGMSFEQMGAMIAVVVQNFGEKMTGNEAGEQLAKAIAKITETKSAVDALKAAGISLHNNDHFMDDLAAKWHQVGGAVEAVIPAMGNTRAVFDAVIKNINEVDDAAKHLGGTFADGILDKLLTKTMGTTAFQLLQLKSGFQALGIVLGKDLLPSFEGIVTEVNNTIPTLMSYHQSISDIIHGGLKLGEVLVLLGALRSSWALVGRSAYDAYRTFSNVFNGTYRLEQLAATPLTAYQRTLISALTTNGQVTAEMEANIKAVAAQTGLSIDQIILKIGELNGAWTTAEAKIVGKTIVIDTAITGIAKATTVTEGQTVVATAGMTKAFTGLKASAGSAALGIASAFSRVIPVIGAAITAITIGITAKQMYDDYQADAETKRFKAFPAQRQDAAKRANLDLQIINSIIASHDYVNDTAAGASSYAFGGIRGHQLPGDVVDALNPGQARYSQLRAQALHDQQILTEVQNASAMGNSSSSVADIQRQLKEQALAAHSQLAKLYETPKGGDLNPVIGGTKGANGPSAAAQEATNLQQVAANNAKILSQDAAKVTNDEAAIDRAKAILALTDLSAASVEKLGKAYNKEATDIKAEIKDLATSQKNQDATYNQLMAKAAAAGGSKTKAGEAYIKQADALEKSAAHTGQQIATLEKQLEALEATHKAVVMEFQHRLDIGQTQGLQSAYNNAALGLKAGGNRDTEQEYQAAIQIAQKYADTLEKAAVKVQNMGAKGADLATALRKQEEAVKSNTETWIQRAQAIQQNAQTIGERLVTSLEDQNMELHAPYDQNVQTAFKAMMELERQYTSDMKTLQLANFTAGQAAEKMWYANQQQIIQNKLALSEYNQEVAQLKQTAFYSAVSGAVDSTGSTLASTFLDSVDGTTTTNNQITALQGQVTSLENERNLLVGQYYDTQRTEISNQVNELNDKIKELQDVAKNPSLGKKLLEDLTKGLTDGFMKQFEDEIKQGLINQFIPKLDKSVGQQQQTVDQFSKVVNGQLKQNFDNWKSGVDKATPVMDKLATALTQFSSGSVTANDGTPLGAIQGFNDVTDGTTPVSFSPGQSSGGGSNIGSAVVPVVAAVGSMALSGLMKGTSVPVGSGSGTVYFNSDGSEVGSPDIYNIDPYGPNTAMQIPYPTESDTVTPNTDLPPSSGSNLSFMQKGMNAVGDFGMAYMGYQTGGVAGGLETGLGAASGLSSIASMFTGGAAGAGGIGSLLGAASPYIGIALGLVSMFSHHDNPALMPDKYDTQQYGQSLADMMGSGYGSAQAMIANGSSFSENSTLRTSIGNQGELSYIAQFIQNNPVMAKQVLTPAELAMFSGLKVGAGDIIGGGNGNETLANGQSVQWQQLASSVQSAVSAIQSFTNVANAATQPLIAIQAFGAGKAQGFSPYYTPGFGNYYSDYMKDTPYYAYNASPTNPAGGSTSNGMQAPVGSGSGQQVQLTSNLVLGGRTIAQIIQNLEYRLSSAGWQRP